MTDHANVEKKQVIIKQEGRTFRCEECECNVFTKIARSKDDVQYVCNGCHTPYRESDEE